MEISKIALHVFGIGGAGAVVFDLILLGLLEFLGKYLMMAIENIQMAKMIQAGSKLSSLVLVAKTATDALLAILKVFGLV